MTTTGTVARVETRKLGLAVISLGGGRTRPQDDIDPAVGFSSLARPGDTADLLGIIHARTEAQADTAEVALRAAYRIAPDAPQPPPDIAQRIA